MISRRMLLGCALLVGSTHCDAIDPTISTQAKIIGGQPEGGDPAVVLLATWSPDLVTLDLCTAVVIAPDLLLTAAHCVDPQTHPDFGLGVFVAADASAYPSASTLIPKLLAVAEVTVHPDYERTPPFVADLAVVRLAAPLSTAPLPVLWTAPTDSWVGLPARIVGYGQTMYEVPNAQKHSALTTLARIDEGDTLTVGDLQHKTCIGDSGGPALMVVDGVETVVGINSYSDLAGCLEPAHYRRTDLYADFLAEFIERPAATGTGGAAAQGGAGGEELDIGMADDESSGCSSAPQRSGPAWPALLLTCGLLISRSRARRRSDAVGRRGAE